MIHTTKVVVDPVPTPPALVFNMKNEEQHYVPKMGKGLNNTFRARRGPMNWVLSFAIILCLFWSGYLLRDYIQQILAVIEGQNDVTICLILLLLYTIVSMPFAWGYILINVATGYLYGLVKGIIITFITATLGIIIAHFLMKMCLGKYNTRWMITSNKFAESLDLVMSTPQRAFKLVVLSRLTPVPFGIQNTFFAMNNTLSTVKYLQATCLGLFPCQLLNVYIGSTFRSMQQLLSDSGTAQIGALVLTVQVLVAIAITVFVIQKGKQELEASIQISNNNFHRMDIEKGIPEDENVKLDGSSPSQQ